MRRVKPDKPKQKLSLQSVSGFEDRVFDAKAKARQPRGKGKDHRMLSSSSRPVLEFEASPRGHHPCTLDIEFSSKTLGLYIKFASQHTPDIAVV